MSKMGRLVFELQEQEYENNIGYRNDINSGQDMVLRYPTRGGGETEDSSEADAIARAYQEYVICCWSQYNFLRRTEAKGAVEC